MSFEDSHSTQPASSNMGITIREICLALGLIAIAALVTYPIARYYWVKAGQNAQIIRNWNMEHER
jgi:predicted LPLAT superfamily acyltransferase